MSLEQSKKIVEAAGDCWHEPVKLSQAEVLRRLDTNQYEERELRKEIRKGLWKGTKWFECSACDEWECEDFMKDTHHREHNPDLSRPENRHLLLGYVVRICNTDEKRIDLEERLLFYLGLSVDGGWQAVTTWEIITAPNEAIMTALCQVIENNSTRAGGEG